MRQEGRVGALRRNIGPGAAEEAPAQRATMASDVGTTNPRDLTPDPAGYQVDDLSIDLAPRRVRRAGTVIPLKALSFDLLVTLARAAPNVLSFEQLSERVWPGLVVTPETIVQRVKLLRGALGDDPGAPRYIEGVRGRGYRMIAQVRAVAEPLSVPESTAPPQLPNVHAGHTAREAAAVSSSIAIPSSGPRPARWVPLGWTGGTVVIVALVAATLAVAHYWRVSQLAVRSSSGTVPVSIQSLAVLPLENLSGDKEQEYFAEGMTDALTTDLAQIGSLRVISRTSAMQFKRSKETLPQIGRELKVDAVVEGAVTRGANRVRVTAQLVEASSDRHLWARSYERDLKDVLALQDEIAQDIAGQIRIKLSPKERSLVNQTRAVDPEAYDDYLKGSYWLGQLSVEGYLKGCGYIRQAIAKAPSYAPAYLGVAECTDSHDDTRKAIAKALALDPSLAEAHTMLGTVKFTFDWDWSGAEPSTSKPLPSIPTTPPRIGGIRSN